MNVGDAIALLTAVFLLGVLIGFYTSNRSE